jgi:hypothetical protein
MLTATLHNVRRLSRQAVETRKEVLLMQTVWSECATAIKANGEVEMKIENSVKLLYRIIVGVVSSTVSLAYGRDRPRTPSIAG